MAYISFLMALEFSLELLFSITAFNFHLNIFWNKIEVSFLWASYNRSLEINTSYINILKHKFYIIRFFIIMAYKPHISLTLPFPVISCRTTLFFILNFISSGLFLALRVLYLSTFISRIFCPYIFVWLNPFDHSNSNLNPTFT